MSKIYLVTLAKETKSPFEPKSDEVKIKEDGEGTGEGRECRPEKKAGSAAEAGRGQSGCGRTAGADCGIARGCGGIRAIWCPWATSSTTSGAKAEKERKIMLFDLEKQKETELGDADGYEISADDKKMLIGQGGSYSIIDLPIGRMDLSERLNLSDLKFNLDREAEWKQIYNECWRQMRDFFYAPNMHGVDWEKVRKNYEPLVPFVRHRADLTYIIGEMIGELSAGHTYVGGGDMPRKQRIKMGLLGAVDREGCRRPDISGSKRF